MAVEGALGFLFVFSCARGEHSLCHNVGCFDTGAVHVSVTVDGEDVFYVDFNNRSVEWQSRYPPHVDLVYTFDYAIYFKSQCKHHLNSWKSDSGVSKVPAAPDVLVYPQDEVTEHVDNTLICFVRNFFPPIVRIKWTKNEKEVASDDPFMRTIPASDGTFQVLSTLSFVPEVGDVYACAVEHETLKEAAVKFYEFSSSETSIGPTVFSAVGVTLGIVAFAAGIGLFHRDNRHQKVVAGAAVQSAQNTLHQSLMVPPADGSSTEERLHDGPSG